MWGLREYNRCMLGNDQPDKPGCINFNGDTTFPRRLGLGGVTVSPTNATFLKGATFNAEMHIATAEVRASLTSPVASLSVHVILDPKENVVLTTITTHPPTEVSITNWVLPLDASMQLPCKPTDNPTVPGCLDGKVGSGVLPNRVLWSQRQPLGNSSSKPISMVLASYTEQVNGQRCNKTSTTSVVCTFMLTTDPLQLTTAVKSNLDLCPGHDKKPGFVCNVDPLNATAAQAVSASGTAIIRDNKEWWFAYWNSSSVQIPGDSVLERFFFAHSYLIGSASRAGKVAAGLWGPWVHSDSPAWAGDFTLVRFTCALVHTSLIRP